MATSESIPDFLQRLVQRDGWIPAYGSRPDEVDPNTYVRLMYRSGDMSSNSLRAAVVDWKWDSWFPMVDVIACLPDNVEATAMVNMLW